jgi:hypothetical protein
VGHSHAGCHCTDLALLLLHAVAAAAADHREAWQRHHLLRWVLHSRVCWHAWRPWACLCIVAVHAWHAVERHPAVGVHHHAEWAYAVGHDARHSATSLVVARACLQERKSEHQEGQEQAQGGSR